MIIDGKQISQKVLEELKEDTKSKNLKLRLAAVLVSSNPGIKKFVELKGKAAREVGVDYDIYEFPETITEERLKEEVRTIVRDRNSDGVLVELPLPENINAQNILNEIPIEKDVDVLSQEAQDLFFSKFSKKVCLKNCNCNFWSTLDILPPAVEAVKTVLEFHKFDIKGKKVAVFGQGVLVGKPLSHWLEQQGAEVFRVDEHTENPRQYSVEADIVVSGVGKPGLITGNMVKKGVVVIDFGYENKEGKMVGDIKFEEVAQKARLITPVPGGIGPVVVAAVLKNLVKLNS